MGIRLLDPAEFEGNILAQLGNLESGVFLAQLVNGKKVVVQRLPQLTDVGVQELALQRLTWIFSMPDTVRFMVEVLRLRNGDLILLEEYVEGVSLRTLVEERGCLSEAQIKYVLRNVLKIMEGFHRRGLVHGALHPAHLIAPARLDISGEEAGSADIDFDQLPGVVPVHWQQSSIRNDDGGYDPVLGVFESSLYGAPELLLEKVYTASDIYTLALSALFLATGRSPWEFRRSRKSILREAGISFAFIEVLETMLEPDAFVRPSTQEVLLALEALPGSELGLFETDNTGDTRSLSFECVGEFSLSRNNVYAAIRPTGDLKLAIASNTVRVVEIAEITWFSSLWNRLSGRSSLKWQLTTLFEFSGGESGSKLVVCHPEEHYAVSTGGAGVVSIWDFTTGAPLRNFSPSVEKTLGLLFHPNGKFVLVVGRSGYQYSLEVWDIRLCTMKATFELSGYFRAAEFSASGDFLTCVLSDSIVIYDTTEPDSTDWHIIATHKELEFDHRVTIAWHHQRDLFAVPDEQGIIRIYGVMQDKAPLILYGNGHVVSALCFIPYSDFLLTSNEPGELILWNFMTGQLLETVPVKHFSDGFLIPIPEHSLIVAVKRYWESVTLWRHVPISRTH